MERDEAAIARWIADEWPQIQQRAADQRAHLVFIDETGFLLTPLVRRSWAPRGRTPVLRSRTRHRRHVSAIGGLSISPVRRRVGWYLQFHLDRTIGQEEVIGFLRHLRRHLRGPLVVVWDRLSAHRGRGLRGWLESGPRPVHLESLPGYAPELNPNEYGWSYLKTGALANFCPPDAETLETQVAAAATQAARQPDLLRSFVRATKLPVQL